MMYTMGGTPNIRIDFDANYEFAPGTESTITPAAVFQRMQGTDYQAFIMDYLMRIPPDNQLDRVQMVTYAASVMPA